MKYLPLGRQNFADIIQNDLLYVDKTRQLYDLIRHGKLYFLSRPRRFGKSLLISKLKYLFSGNKALFQNLYITKQTDYDWPIHPVLSFNFAKLGKRAEELEQGIQYILDQESKRFDITLPSNTLGLQLDYLVRNLSEKGKPIVLLIDEYDKPIIDFLTAPKKAKQNRQILKDFFSPLKDLEAQGHIHFLFITGVSKFSKVSLFSDLNNLTDLTIHVLSDDLVGITQAELTTYFADHIEAMAQHLQTPPAQLLTDIQFWYNGYAYNPAIRLYNPYSLLSFFSAKRFGNFWFATGTPTFLVNTIRNQMVNPESLESIQVPETFFDKYSLEQLDVVGLLFQTGYLTIKRTVTRRHRTKYFLGYPNAEVRLSMMHNLVEAFTFKRSSIVGNVLLTMEDALDTGDVKLFVDQLEILLSDISYHLLPKKRGHQQTEFKAWEGYFQTIIYLVTSFMGYQVQSEITKHQGRLDLLVETEAFLYLMEFKLDESAEHAIQQIKDRKYAAAYRNSAKTVYLVGIGFSKAERNVATWDAEVWG